MYEMVNALTSLLLLLTITEASSFYLNFSIFFFSLISSVVHILPENLDYLLHVVRIFSSNILFALIDMNPILGILLSLVDLTHLIDFSKNISKLREIMTPIPRQIVDVYLVYHIYNEGFKLQVFVLVVLKFIYLLDRLIIFQKNLKNNYHLLHSAKYFGLYLSLMILTKSTFYFLDLIKIALLLELITISMLKGYNLYIRRYSRNRLPPWLKESKELVHILVEKIEKNNTSNKLYNYIMKPWTTHLKMEIVTWQKMHFICEELVKKIDKDSIDVVVGITTGGAYVACLIAHLLGKQFDIVHSKLWSGISFYQNAKIYCMFAMGYNVNPRISGLPDVNGKRVLLCDDTTYSGITITKNMEYIKSNCEPKEIKTLCLWISNNFIPDYYYSARRVPILWEWGAELD